MCFTQSRFGIASDGADLSEELGHNQLELPGPRTAQFPRTPNSYVMPGGQKAGKAGKATKGPSRQARERATKRAAGKTGYVNVHRERKEFYISMAFYILQQLIWWLMMTRAGKTDKAEELLADIKQSILKVHLVPQRQRTKTFAQIIQMVDYYHGAAQNPPAPLECPTPPEPPRPRAARTATTETDEEVMQRQLMVKAVEMKAKIDAMTGNAGVAPPPAAAIDPTGLVIQQVPAGAAAAPSARAGMAQEALTLQSIDSMFPELGLSPQMPAQAPRPGEPRLPPFRPGAPSSVDEIGLDDIFRMESPEKTDPPASSPQAPAKASVSSASAALAEMPAQLRGLAAILEGPGGDAEEEGPAL